MATYAEFCSLASQFGGVALGADVWSFNVQGRGEGRTQRVFVFHEVMPPGRLEFLQLKSAFASIGSVDCGQVLRDWGQLNIGAIGYNPNFDPAGNPVDGSLTVTTSIPLSLLDLSQPTEFFLFLNVFAQGTDNLEQQLGHPGIGDLF